MLCPGSVMLQGCIQFSLVLPQLKSGVRKCCDEAAWWSSHLTHPRGSLYHTHLTRTSFCLGPGIRSHCSVDDIKDIYHQHCAHVPCNGTHLLHAIFQRKAKGHSKEDTHGRRSMMRAHQGREATWGFAALGGRAACPPAARKPEGTAL